MQEIGLVVAASRHLACVLLPDGRVEECRLHGRFRSDLRRGQGLAVGDRVTLEDAPAPGPAPSPPRRVLDVLPRTSVLSRGLVSRADARIHADRVVAANVDLCLVVLAARDPRFRPAVADRLIALVRACGIPPVLVVNKAEDAAPELLEGVIAPYRAMGVETFAASAVSGQGLEALAARCAGRFVALLGPSGVGKSTLTVALTGEAAETGDPSTARKRRGRGRHTTVQARVYGLPGGGRIVDTAGIRSLALPEGAGAADAFPEIAALAPECRFADCRHEGEPGCAVGAAVREGSLDAAAYRGYLRALRDQSTRPSREGRGRPGPRPPAPRRDRGPAGTDRRGAAGGRRGAENALPASRPGTGSPPDAR